MPRLHREDIIQLQKILINHVSGFEKPSRYLLSIIRISESISGIKFDTTQIDFNQSPRGLVEDFTAKILIREEFLLPFLEYFSSKFQEDSYDLSHIKFYINKISSSSNKEHLSNYTSLLDEVRQEKAETPVVLSTKNNKIDINIVNHNLGALRHALKNELDFRGVHAFSIIGHENILKNYIIKRILCDFIEKTKRKYGYPIPINYSDNNTSLLQTIKQGLQQQRNCDCLVDLIQQNKDLNTVMIIWNYASMQDTFIQYAIDFVEQVKNDCTYWLLNNRRCLLIILANIYYGNHNDDSNYTDESNHYYDYKIDGFTSLKTPKQFILYKDKGEDEGLIEWFDHELDLLDLESDKIEQLCHRLRRHNGQLFVTYKEIQDIIDELNGRISNNG